MPIHCLINIGVSQSLLVQYIKGIKKTSGNQAHFISVKQFEQ